MSYKKININDTNTIGNWCQAQPDIAKKINIYHSTLDLYNSILDHKEKGYLTYVKKPVLKHLPALCHKDEDYFVFTWSFDGKVYFLVKQYILSIRWIYPDN